MVTFSSGSVDCCREWLEVKHECLLCKSQVTKTDRYLSQTILLDEDVALPPTSRKQSLADTSENTASEALGRPFFLEEFTKILQLINDKHATYKSLKQYSALCGQSDE